MKKLLLSTLTIFFLVGLRSTTAQATFYGPIPKGYQYVEKKGSGYGVYVPSNFDPNKRPALIFAFGRTQDDLALTREQLKDYAELWVEEAEKRGYVVVIPYWQPVVVESGQHTEKFYLEILQETKMMYNIHPRKVLVVGFGLGAVEAFSLAAYYPDEFNAVVTIGRSPLHDSVRDNLLKERLMGGLPPGKLPPVLLVHGENDGAHSASWLEEDKVFLQERGAQVELKSIPGVGYEHNPQVNSVILDWFDSLASSS